MTRKPDAVKLKALQTFVNTSPVPLTIGSVIFSDGESDGRGGGSGAEDREERFLCR